MRSNRGFTLMEMVVVIAMMGALAIGVTQFINFAMKIYLDGQQWGQAVSQHRYGLQRLSRELRDAVPGSVAIANGSAGYCLSFSPIEQSGRFIAAPMLNSANQVSFYRMSCCVGNDCDDCFSSGNGAGVALLNGYQLPDPLPTVASSQCDSSNLCQMTLSANLADGDYSPGQRFYAAGSTVAYCLNSSGQLTRSSQGSSSLMADGFANDLSQCNLNQRDNAHCPFLEQPPTLNRNSVLQLQFWLSQADQSQRFVQEVQIENLP
ncbi:PulJ/GspJ family protein [Ferrimonas aestuarii]|uniref:Prepilin-type N-terminal cleavage/methylation domain-containing protein n=1 Tax=Ferrimonas aestuarii TaxID=2569539 RepID=A0A4V5NYQ3_9GAMM|nr:prepilin-type N-terminal cleavage/methylation domain-containing protein [Ferrimonas aestuarii]TKB55986.1 prepilin-type N-terminal cleavage/methylation domain-containing protein [Ferrimonas aestuarii]